LNPKSKNKFNFPPQESSLDPPLLELHLNLEDRFVGIFSKTGLLILKTPSELATA